MMLKHKPYLSLLSSRPSVMVIVAIMISIAWIHANNKFWFRNQQVVKHDVVSYYSYLPAAFVYYDLTFSFFDDDPGYFYDKMYQYVAPNGGYYQKVTMGLAFMYMPFFLMGHFTAWITGAEMSGYSPPYMFFLLLSSAFYLLLGLLVLRKMLLRYNPEWIVALVLLSIVTGTQVLHYATIEAAMPHVYNFTLFVIFIWLTDKWFGKKLFRHALALGFVFGLISLIRPTNALIAIVFMLYDVKTFRELQQRPAFFLKHWKHILLIALLSFVVWLPQLIFWKVNTGSWLFFSYEGESFFFLNPQIINGLFSYRKGWLLYTPVMVLALAGIGLLYREKRELFLPVLVFTVFNIYIVFSWWSWWYGGGFGIRPMIDSYPLMAFALAALISQAAKHSKRIRYIINSVIIILVLHGIYQTMQYRFGAIHYDSMSKAVYWHSVGRMKAHHDFFDLLEPPDYEKARRGIQAIRPHSKTRVFDSMFCDYESLTEDKRFIQSSGRRIFISGVELLSENTARSGLRSVKLTSEKLFGSAFQIRVVKDEVYHLSVWKYPYHSDGRLVFRAPDVNDFYSATGIVSEIDEKGWGRIELIDTIPSQLHGMFRVYFWNPGQDSIWFDDLRIRRILAD